MLVRAKVDVTIPGSGDILNVGDAPRSVPAALALYMCMQGLVTLEGYEDEIMSLVQASGDPVQQGGIGDIAKVANMAQEPGHDADFDVVNGSTPVQVCTFVTGDDLQVTGPCRVFGFSVRVATATAAIEVEDGLTDAGTSKFSIPSGAAVGVHHFGGIGIEFTTGAFLDYGSATGTVALLVQLAAGSVIEA